MSIELDGRHLIFLISQPRAGSTLLQRMLKNHPNIHTTAEPWTLLHPVYGLRENGHEAEYNAQSAWEAVDDFIQQLPHQRTSYLEGLRLMHTHLYNSMIEGTGKTYFLDKTPRYYHIIPELYEIFPEATFIILLRNPLAVACSVMDTWIKDSWFKFHKYRADLLEAPHHLLDGIALLGDRCLTVHYEQLLSNPDEELQKITQHIGIEFIPDLLHYNLPQSLQVNSSSDESQEKSLGRSPSVQLAPPKSSQGFGYRDQSNVFHQGKPDKENVNKWVHHLKHAQRWRVLQDYYEALGDETIRKMGTCPDTLKSLIDAHRPSPFQRALTFPLQWFAKNPRDRQSFPYETYLVKFIRLFQRQKLLTSWLTEKTRLPSPQAPLPDRGFET